MGGEKQNMLMQMGYNTGSPPRGRGKAASGALAGGVQMDHPRVGGEKAPAGPLAAGLAGSPPRGRGKVSAAHVAMQAKRITPAWAGKS